MTEKNLWVPDSYLRAITEQVFTPGLYELIAKDISIVPKPPMEGPDRYTVLDAFLVELRELLERYPDVSFCSYESIDVIYGGASTELTV